MGYRFSPQFANNLVAKYDARGRRLTLDNFIVACVQELIRPQLVSAMLINTGKYR
jgi:hypothetical protein